MKSKLQYFLTVFVALNVGYCIGITFSVHWALLLLIATISADLFFWEKK